MRSSLTLTSRPQLNLALSWNNAVRFVLVSAEGSGFEPVEKLLLENWRD